MNETRYFLKKIQQYKLGVFLLLTLLIIGCGKGSHIIGGPFEDTSLFLNTEFDQKLIDELRYKGCFNFPPKNILDETAIERYKTSRMRIFHELFPKGTPVNTVFNTLISSGAKCRTETKGEQNLTQCALTKEFIYGSKELILTGWQISRIHLTKSSFEYLITTRENRILDVIVNIIGCEFYEIDKYIYEKFKIIKPIRRLK